MAFGLGRWVAAGAGTTNTLATSPDGISWAGSGNGIFSSQVSFDSLVICLQRVCLQRAMQSLSETGGL